MILLTATIPTEFSVYVIVIWNMLQKEWRDSSTIQANEQM